MKVKCDICGCLRFDLTKHLKKAHNLTVSEYKDRYSSVVISPDVERKRKETCKNRYGLENYKNREAIALSNEIYEGGHSLKDPAIREKGRETKKQKYGDPNFTNREKAKQTCKERYGVEYSGAIPDAVEKRVNTLKERYGRVFNIDVPHNKKEIPTDFKDRYLSGEATSVLALHYGVSGPTITRWAKDLGLVRKVVLMSERKVMSPDEIVFEYFDSCIKEKKVLSFYDFGKLKGNKYQGKLKRLFNKGKKFHDLKQELFDSALDLKKQSEFLEKLK